MVAKPVQLEQALELALQLSPIDKVRLLERVASTLEQDIAPQSQPIAEFPADSPPTWTEDELHELMNLPRLTPAELIAWLAANPPTEPWGELGDDEDAAEYVHRMRRKNTWSTPEDILPGDNA